MESDSVHHIGQDGRAEAMPIMIGLGPSSGRCVPGYGVKADRFVPSGHMKPRPMAQANRRRRNSRLHLQKTHALA